MLCSVEQAFVGRDEKRAPLKTPAWEATILWEEAKKGLISSGFKSRGTGYKSVFTGICLSLHDPHS